MRRDSADWAPTLTFFAMSPQMLTWPGAMAQMK